MRMIMLHLWHYVNVAETPRTPPTFENAGARPLPGPRLGLVVEDLHVEAAQPVVPQVEGEVGHVGEHVDEVGGQLLQAGAPHHQHQLVALDALEGVQGQRVQLRARQLQLLELGAERAVDLTWAGQFDRLRVYEVTWKTRSWAPSQCDGLFSTAAICYSVIYRKSRCLISEHSVWFEYPSGEAAQGCDSRDDAAEAEFEALNARPTLDAEVGEVTELSEGVGVEPSQVGQILYSQILQATQSEEALLGQHADGVVRNIHVFQLCGKSFSVIVHISCFPIALQGLQ